MMDMNKVWKYLGGNVSKGEIARVMTQKISKKHSEKISKWAE